MIPTLIFLLTIILLGTAIYLYFRQEQKKSFPKDKYNEALDNDNRKKLPKDKNFTKFTITSLLVFNLYNFLILIGTFIIAFLIGLLLVTSGSDKLTFLIFFPILIFFVLLFPTGLIQITQIASSNYEFELGWLIYFIVIILGSFAKDRFVFISIYSVLIILLILNVAEWVQHGL